MDVSDDYVQTLLSMGFPNEGEIRRALKLAKNDLNEALSILTNDGPVSTFDTLDETDIEMKDVNRSAQNGSRTSSTATLPVYGPAPPPSYDDAMQYQIQDQSTQSASQAEGEGSNQKPAEDDENSLTFPVANLIELEGRVFTESWSIPYKKEESLGKCLLAATRLAKEGLCDNDQDCKRFLERCMPESFQKLLTSGAVHRWGPEIQEGIVDMLQLFVDLVAIRIQYMPISLPLLDVLAMAFNPATEFHTKNRSKRPDRAYEERIGESKIYAISPSSTSYKEPFGWLTNLINRFAEKGGIDEIKKKKVPTATLR